MTIATFPFSTSPTLMVPPLLPTANLPTSRHPSMQIQAWDTSIPELFLIVLTWYFLSTSYSTARQSPPTDTEYIRFQSIKKSVQIPMWAGKTRTHGGVGLGSSKGQAKTIPSQPTAMHQIPSRLYF